MSENQIPKLPCIDCLCFPMCRSKLAEHLDFTIRVYHTLTKKSMYVEAICYLREKCSIFGDIIDENDVSLIYGLSFKDTLTKPFVRELIDHYNLKPYLDRVNNT